MSFIQDAIHGDIKVSRNVLPFIQTPQFQRLRNIKQLGSVVFIFPNATHTRFEHSLGTYHLGRQLITELRKTQPELAISKRDIQCVEIAALCHDLGHGPFSHLFDQLFMPAVGHGTWTHEAASQDMLEYLIDDNYIDVESEDVSFIKDLITGKPKSTSQREEQQYLFQIVANKKNGLDVDKLDYLARDSYSIHTIEYPFESDVSMWAQAGKKCKVINGELCFDEIMKPEICDVFETRRRLFEEVYLHPQVRAIDLMITDVLVLSNDILHIQKRCEDMPNFLHLTDHILQEIETSNHKELRQARQLLYRIRCGNYYKLTSEEKAPYPPQHPLDYSYIYHHHNPTLDRFGVNHGLHHDNPLDHITFYPTHYSEAIFEDATEGIDLTLPPNYTLLRNYSK